MSNYYEILDINKNANKDDIKTAYKKLALKYHPDRNQDCNKKDEYEEKFKQISEAYEVLSNPAKKQNYDMFGSADVKQHNFGHRAGTVNFDHIFQYFHEYKFF